MTDQSRTSRTRRFITLGVLTPGLLVPVVGMIGSCFAAPRYAGPVSDHFDGERFFTPGATDADEHGFSDLLKWQLNRERGPWPEAFDAEPGPPPPTKVTDGVRVTFVGHATTLVQLDGVNILTDPHFSTRASPVDFAGPSRVRPPGIRFEDLPPIHAVVLSHNHYDHMDASTLQRLSETHAPKVLAGLGNRAYLDSELGVKNVVDLDWGESVTVGNVTITSAPCKHFSGRGLGDRAGTLWSSWVLRGRSGKVYFAGDTAYGPHFKATGDLHGPFDVALLPIGAYQPRWFMSAVHIDPAQAIDAHQDLRATRSVGVHFGSFPLADDGFDEPVRELEAQLQKRAPPPDFIVLAEGEGRTFDATDAVDDVDVDVDAGATADLDPDAGAR